MFCVRHDLKKTTQKELQNLSADHSKYFIWRAYSLDEIIELPRHPSILHHSQAQSTDEWKMKICNKLIYNIIPKEKKKCVERDDCHKTAPFFL